MFLDERMLVKRFLPALLAALLLLGASAAGADTTTRVSGNTVTSEVENGSTGWWFGRDPGNQTPYEFNDDQASIGAGSLYVPPIGATDTDKFIGELFLFEPLTSFSVDYLSDTPKHVYLNVYANTPATAATSPANFFECAFAYVATATGGWQTLSTTSTTPTFRKRGYTGPCVLADMVVRAVSINVGQSSASDLGASAYLDNVRVVTASGLHVYDFDPAPLTKDDCKNGGWADHGFKNQGACVSSVARAGR